MIEKILLADHRVAARYPVDHGHRLENDDRADLPQPAVLVLVDAAGREVARFPRGTWHWFGREDEAPFCAFETPDPNCPRCHPAPAMIAGLDSALNQPDAARAQHPQPELIE